VSDPKLEAISGPLDPPSKEPDALSKGEDEDIGFARARSLAGLTVIELQHFQAERYVTLLTNERRSALSECEALRGGHISKWFSLLAGAMGTVGGLLTRKPDYEMAGYFVIGCGITLAIATLIIPSRVLNRSMKRMKNLSN